MVAVKQTKFDHKVHSRHPEDPKKLASNPYRLVIDNNGTKYQRNGQWFQADGELIGDSEVLNAKYPINVKLSPQEKVLKDATDAANLAKSEALKVAETLKLKLAEVEQKGKDLDAQQSENTVLLETKNEVVVDLPVQDPDLDPEENLDPKDEDNSGE